MMNAESYTDDPETAGPVKARLSTDGVFFTVQGEGPLAGVPSIFLRLDTCNLHCKWGETLCDAHYTSWTPNGTTISLSDLFIMVSKTLNSTRCRHLVITGGEPALQPEVVRLLARYMRDLSGHSTIETNGTRYIDEHGLSLVCLSPKLRGSTPVGTPYEKAHERARINVNALRLWMGDGTPYYFKFVINDQSDISEVQEVLRDVRQRLEPEHVLFMPQGIDRDELWERGRWLAEQCKKLNVRFAPRMQIDLYGNKPGT
jgi:7-carboxy-7-deazaguanine synthase